MQTVQLFLVEPDHRPLRQLIEKLDAELYERYPVEEVHVIDFEHEPVHDIVFVIASENDKAIGCGALRPIDAESTELKRFFVEKSHRNKGVASRMLRFLEELAVQEGFKSIKLETGAMQPEAIQLYTKYGYEPIECFGEYIGCKESLCYEKKIADIR